MVVLLLMVAPWDPLRLQPAAAETSVEFTGIEGQALIGPACPGPVTPGGGCVDRPYEATVIVLDEQARVVTRFRADAAGRFRVPLPPGTYTLRPETPGPGPLPFAREQIIAVSPGQCTRVRIIYDTGIR
jgi:hypothetical protein